MNRVLLLLGLVFLSVVNSYSSYTNISSCQTITLPGEYRINESFPALGNCFEIQTSNVSINCNHNTVTGDGSGAFLFSVTDDNNISLRNCSVASFDFGIFFGAVNQYNDNLFFENLVFTNLTPSISYYPITINYFTDLTINNLTVLNSSSGIELFGSNYFFGTTTSLSNINIENSLGNETCFGVNSTFCIVQVDNIISTNISIVDDFSQWSMFFMSSRNNLFSDIYINNSLNGIYYLDIFNNTFENIFINTQNTANYFRASSSLRNNVFDSMEIDSSLISIEFSGILSESISNNTFRNSNLGNYSSIISNDWNYTTPNIFENNQYLLGTQTSECFDNPLNQTCETSVSAVISSTSSLFPVFGLVNVIIILGGLFLYFI